MTRREEVITTLLERLPELVDPMQSGNGLGDTGLRLMPPTYTASVREIERLLRLMRDDRASPLVRLLDKNGAPTGEKASVRSLWWHLTERYVRCRQSTKDVPVRRKAKHGKTLLVIERRVVTSHNSRVDQAKVRAGVTWLAGRWGLAQEPMLPNELLVAA